VDIFNRFKTRAFLETYWSFIEKLEIPHQKDIEK